jgi:two-component system LytT family response regulator/two-component system response regulator LytT
MAADTAPLGMKESLKSEPRGVAMATISAIIVDDEPLARAELAFLLKAHPDVQIVAEARNGVEALQLIKEHQPDLVFLDIAMPGQDGLEVVRRLLDKKPKGKAPHIIFATAYDQHAVKAFELNAMDYLLKPVEKGRLAQSLQRVRKLVEASSSASETMEELLRTLQNQSKPAQQSKLLLRTAGRLLLVDAKDLVFASIEEGRITVATKDMEGESNFRTIEDLQSTLDPSVFWRAHRSYIVNLNHIKEVVPWFKSTYQLRMADRKATEIPVSRAQTKRLRELLNL